MTTERAEIAEELNRVTHRVIGAAIRLHRALGHSFPKASASAALSAVNLMGSQTRGVHSDHDPTSSPIRTVRSED